MTRREIVVIDRGSRGAHPSYASGGYVVLNPGATGYRNADLVARDPHEIRTWCRENGCEETLLPGEGLPYLRYHVRFPSLEAFAAFERRFKSKAVGVG